MGERRSVGGVMGRLAVLTTGTLLGVTGLLSLTGLTTSASVDAVTGGSRIADVVWSLLFVLGAVSLWCSVLVAPRHPTDPKGATIAVERLGALWLVVGSGVFLVSVLIAQGLQGLQAAAYVLAAIVNLIGRQVAVWAHARGVVAEGQEIVREVRAIQARVGTDGTDGIDGDGVAS